MNQFIERPTPLSLGAIAVGALIGLLIDLGFTLLGSGIGLGAMQVDPLAVPGPGTLLAVGVFTTIAMIVAFSVGGYVAARVSPARQSWDAALHGIASFALSALVMVFVLGSSAALGVGGVLARLGLGVTTVSFVALGLLILGAIASAWGGVVGLRGAYRAAKGRGDTTYRVEDRAA